MNTLVKPYTIPSQQWQTVAARRPIFTGHLIRIRGFEVKIGEILGSSRRHFGELAASQLDAIEAESWHRRQHIDHELADLGVLTIRVVARRAPSPPAIEALARTALLALAAAEAAYQPLQEFASLARLIDAATFAASARRDIETSSRALRRILLRCA